MTENSEKPTKIETKEIEISKERTPVNQALENLANKNTNPRAIYSQGTREYKGFLIVHSDGNAYLQQPNGFLIPFVD